MIFPRRLLQFLIDDTHTPTRRSMSRHHLSILVLYYSYSSLFKNNLCWTDPLLSTIGQIMLASRSFNTSTLITSFISVFSLHCICLMGLVSSSEAIQGIQIRGFPTFDVCHIPFQSSLECTKYRQQSLFLILLKMQSDDQ